MNKSQEINCRFCTELQTPNSYFNLDNDEKKLTRVSNKLQFLNASYIDITAQNKWPKTMCFVCYYSLNKAYDFLQNVKKSQDFFTNLEKKEEKPPQDDEQFKIEIKVEPCNDFSIEESTDHEEESKNDTNNLKTNLNANKTINKPKLTKKIVNNIVTSWSSYPWSCKYCDKVFETMDLLRSHSKAQHGKCYAFKCTCNMLKNYNNINFFIRHVGSRHRSGLSNRCYYCNLKVTSEQNFNDHIKTHFQNPQTSCPACGEIFENDTTLQDHLKQYGGKQKRKPPRKAKTPFTTEELTCPLCKKVYKNLDSLREHTKYHEKKRDHTCDRCGKSFLTRSQLNSHVSRTHEKIKPYPCKICNKRFGNLSNLKRHVEVHSGDRPFACEQCGKTYRTEAQLQGHQIVHTDLMPFICKYCNRKFRFRTVLTNHLRQHTGVKPYACKTCNMEFTGWSNYSKHMKCRHSMDIRKKKYTPEGTFPIDPETGQIVQVHDKETEKWRSQILQLSGKKA